MKREGFDVAGCTVARLMSLQGIIRGKPIRTTSPHKQARRIAFQCQFKAPAPNRLWVSDPTYVAIWQGFVYAPFVIDAFARRIVGWRVSRTACKFRPRCSGAKLCMIDTPRMAAFSCIIPTGAFNTYPFDILSGLQKHRAFCRKRRRQLRQRTRQNDQRVLQGRGHPSARTMTQLRGGRVRYLGMGRLVQPPANFGAHL